MTDELNPELLKAGRELLSGYISRPVEKMALLGDGAGNLYPTDGNGRVIPFTVWARTAEGAPVKVKNYRAPFVNNLPVLIGYDPQEPRLLQVLSVRRGISQQADSYPSVAAHGATHRWMGNPGGNDVVWVELRQFMPLRVSAAGGLIIEVFQAAIWRDEWVYVSPTADLSAHVPGGTNQARWVLVELDTVGAIVLTAGTAKDKVSLTLADCPARTLGRIPLAAVHLETGQTEIKETRTQLDIVDLRFATSGVSETPPPTQAGQILISLDGTSWSAALPLTGDNGEVLTGDDNTIVVSG